MRIIKVITYLPAIVIMFLLVVSSVIFTFGMIMFETMQKIILETVRKICYFYDLDKDKYTKVVSYE